jgi:hypothetical protein
MYVCMYVCMYPIYIYLRNTSHSVKLQHYSSCFPQEMLELGEKPTTVASRVCGVGEGIHCLTLSCLVFGWGIDRSEDASQ